MKNVTVRLHIRTIAELEREARNQGCSRSERIRNVIETRDERDPLQREHDRVRAEYEREIAELEQKVESLENQNKVLTDAYQVNQETQELVRYRKDRRQSPLGRLKTWLFDE